MELFTKWNVDLNLLSGGPEPPTWLKEADAVWLRKCNVLKYHTALSQYEFVYTCGYSRYILGLGLGWWTCTEVHRVLLPHFTVYFCPTLRAMRWTREIVPI